jgi:Cu(I)/Ag(I) efflux system protein CusF
MKRFLLAVVIALASPVPALATEAHHPSQAGAPVADGEVRKVDKDARKLTIRHGPLPQLDMPTPMTMVYQVKDPALLDKVRPGDKVKFVAEKIGGAFTVISIDPAP